MENIDEYSSEQIDLRDYLYVILKRKWTMITIFTVIVVTVAIKSYTAIPIYQATTRLIIEKENPNVLSIEEVMDVDSSGTDYYQTQYKIIESRTVAREVIKRLNLNNSEEFFPKPKDNFLSGIKRSVREIISSYKALLTLFKTEKEYAVQEKEKYENYEEGYEMNNALVSAFIGRVNVRPIRNSRLVDISFQAKDPVLAQKNVNTLAMVYIDQNMDIKLKAAQHATKWLHGQIGEKRKNVEKAEQALLKYKQEQHIITDFTSDVEKITAQKLAQLNTRVVDAQSARVEAETRYKQAAAMKGSADMLDSVPEVLNNQLIQQIKSMEAELYKRMAELSKKYGKKHPRMVAVESELRAVRKRKAQEIKRVINSLRNEYKVALARENSLKKAFAEQKEETFGLNQKAIRYSVLRREAESARHMYEMLFNRFKEATLTEDMKTGNIRVVDRAEVQRSPVKPNKKRNILLAIIVGLAMGTGISFFLEYLDNTIQYAEDIEQDLNLPYLGTIPMFTTENNSQNKPENELITAGSLNSVVSEAYRDIRTNILFSSVEATPQIILVSSALPLEGKSVTAANLAVTMAQAGSKVLIIDCDMRRPKIHKLFSIDMDRGISNLLTGDYNAGRAIVHTKIPNLDVLASGPGVPNATDVLGTKRLDDLLSALRKYYDNIIIDSPPATLLADAVVLSKFVDGVVIVVRAADTAKKIVKNGAEKFLNVGAKIVGTVLNGVVLSRYSHYYRYSYYYSDEYEGGSKWSRGKKDPKSGNGQPARGKAGKAITNFKKEVHW